MMTFSYLLRALVVGTIVMVGGGLTAEEPLTMVQGNRLTIVKVIDANQFLAYSKAVGVWNKHAFPDDIKAAPVISNAICVFWLSGDSITELVGVDQRGTWRPWKLPRPTGTDCKPIVGNDVAVFMVDEYAHAFSAQTGTWDSIVTRGKPSVDNDSVGIMTDDSVAMFSAQTGKWAVASLKKDGK